LKEVAAIASYHEIRASPRQLSLPILAVEVEITTRRRLIIDKQLKVRWLTLVPSKPHKSRRWLRQLEVEHIGDLLANALHRERFSVAAPSHNHK